ARRSARAAAQPARAAPRSRWPAARRLRRRACPHDRCSSAWNATTRAFRSPCGECAGVRLPPAYSPITGPISQRSHWASAMAGEEEEGEHRGEVEGGMDADGGGQVARPGIDARQQEAEEQ